MSDTYKWWSADRNGMYTRAAEELAKKSGSGGSSGGKPVPLGPGTVSGDEVVPLTGDRNHYLDTSVQVMRALQEAPQGEYMKQAILTARKDCRRNPKQQGSIMQKLQDKLRQEYKLFVLDRVLQDLVFGVDLQ